MTRRSDCSQISVCSVFFNDTATTEIYTLSLHDALPILVLDLVQCDPLKAFLDRVEVRAIERSEEHTSELQSPKHLVCRLLLEKKRETRFPTEKWCHPGGCARSRRFSQCALDAWHLGASRPAFRTDQPAVFFFFNGAGDTGIHPLSPPGPFPI